jgi:hypothetical protein
MAKAIKPKDNNEVIELEAEEIPLDKQIDNTLVKYNLTDAVISDLKEKYGELRLKSIDDKESYLEVCAARKEVRKWGILTEKITKAGRQKAIDIQKLWLKKESDVLDKIAAVQDPLDAEIKKYEDEVQRKETEAANRREEAYIKRQSQLLKMGASYENGSFNLNQVGYDMATIKDSDDDIWAETILPKYWREYEKNESERVAVEKKREEEALALRVQQEEMDRQRKEFEQQQAEFKKQQDEAAQKERDRLAQISREEQEKEKEKRLAEQRADDERRDKMRAKLQARGNQLAALGMTFNFQYDAYVFQDVNIDNKTEICLWTDDEWDAKIKEITPIIEQRKQAAEEKRLAQIEKEKQEAIAAAALAERQKIEREQKEAKEKADREAALKAEEALKASDKQKWQTYVDYHNAGVVPEMKSPTYRAKIAEAQKFIQKAVNL